jgi:hypothetical protein
METLATVLSYASGFALMRYHENPPELIATSLAINAGLGPLIVIIARRRHRGSLAWIALGFTLGLWALAAVLLMGPAAERSDRDPGAGFPPTSHAA